MFNLKKILVALGIKPREGTCYAKNMATELHSQLQPLSTSGLRENLVYTHTHDPLEDI